MTQFRHCLTMVFCARCCLGSRCIYLSVDTHHFYWCFLVRINCSVKFKNKTGQKMPTEWSFVGPKMTRYRRWLTMVFCARCCLGSRYIYLLVDTHHCYWCFLLKLIVLYNSKIKWAKNAPPPKWSFVGPKIKMTQCRHWLTMVFCARCCLGSRCIYLLVDTHHFY